jgi:peptidyl-prolyl cis-trans isomerase SurA
LIQALKPWGSLCVVTLAVMSLASSCNHGGSDKDVVAKVNAYKISRSELDKVFNRQIAGSPQKPNAEQEAALRLQLLEQLIGQQIYLQKAEKLGIVATDDEVESKLAQDKAPFTKEEFEKKLKEAGFTEDERKQEIRRSLTIEKLFNKEIAAKVTITDSDIQSYYNDYKSQFNIIEPQYYLAHIFVSNQPNVPSGEIPGKAQNDAEARAKIRMIYNRLQSGEDFATVANHYSEDLNTARGGGAFQQPFAESSLRKDTDAASRDAVLKLKAGQFSDIVPIPTTQKPLGYRIIKLIAKEVAGQRELNDPAVQQLIRNQLRNQRENFLRAAYDEVLRDGADVRNYYAEDLLKNTGQK